MILDEIKEVQSVRPKTKVQINFNDIDDNVHEYIIKIAKDSVTLQDLKPQLKIQLKKFCMFDIAMYVKTKENGTEILEEITDNETADPLPFYDGKMISLEFWPK